MYLWAVGTKLKGIVHFDTFRTRLRHGHWRQRCTRGAPEGQERGTRGASLNSLVEEWGGGKGPWPHLKFCWWGQHILWLHLNCVALTDTMVSIEGLWSNGM